MKNREYIVIKMKNKWKIFEENTWKSDHKTCTQNLLLMTHFPDTYICIFMSHFILVFIYTPHRETLCKLTGNNKYTGDGGCFTVQNLWWGNCL